MRAMLRTFAGTVAICVLASAAHAGDQGMTEARARELEGLGHQ